jgi:NADH:ubiquinone oxidoreductase subunit 6 (subunit J)
MYLVFTLLDPIYVLLSLIMLFTNLALILLFLGSEFIFIIFLIIYVGAIAMLVLFSIMMLNLKRVRKFQSIKNYKIILFSLILFLFNFYKTFELNQTHFIKLYFSNSGSNEFLIFYNYINKLEFGINQMKGISLIFYTQSYPLFLFGGLILLLGMIGPIILIISEKN